jgi:adenylate cyclase class 2
MSFEVEQKFRTDSHGPIADRLRQLGAVARSRIDQEDVYFNHPARDFAQSGEAFRIRRNGDCNALTYKGPRLEGPTKTRPEIEVAFAEGTKDLSRMIALLDQLGFRKVAAIRKQRTPFHLTRDGRAVEVTLDLAEGLGTFVEVETIARDEADLPHAQRVILELADALGLHTVEPRSYLRMALEYRAAASEA